MKMANKTVNKVGKDFDKVVDEMKKLGPKFAKADGKEKEKILKKLKELTAKKKDLKAEIERAVMDAEKDVDLQIEIKQMIKSVLSESLNEATMRSNIVQKWNNSDVVMSDMENFLEMLYKDGNFDTMDDMMNTFAVLSKLAKDYMKAMM
tara:strand:- start:318 stop:764 length:447 start_codon:yes stop_codon:yes gene_type:complete